MQLFVKRLSLILSVLLLLAHILSLRWTLAYSADRAHLYVGMGAICILVVGDGRRGIGWDIGSIQYLSCSELANAWSNTALRLRWGVNHRKDHWLLVPFWMLTVGCGLPWAMISFLSWKRCRRVACARICRACGYDLRGNVSGRCPECGIEITEGGADGA